MAGPGGSGLGMGIWATGAAVAAVVAGIAGYQVFWAPGDVMPRRPPEQTAAAPASASAPLPEATAPAEGTPASASDPAAPPAAVPPQFDVVRIDTAGGALVAGRGVARSDMRLLLDGAELHQTRSDGAGSFVAMFDLPPSPLPRVLGLEMVLEDGTRLLSEQTVLISPTLSPAGPVADAAPAGDPVPQGALAAAPVAPETAPVRGAPLAQEPLGPPAPSVGEVEAALADAAAAVPDSAGMPATPQPEMAEQASADETAATGTTVMTVTTVMTAARAGQVPRPSEAPVTRPAPRPGSTGTGPAAEASAPEHSAPGPISIAPTVLIADSEGVRVVQAGPGPMPQAQVVLDTISYDSAGEVVLTGRGPAASDVRLYLDNQPVQLARIDPGGAWRAGLPQVDPGTYTLRVDQISAGGAVESRMETPFLREEPARLATLPRNEEGQSLITVQPGNSLWTIARDHYGDGVLYVQLYRANRRLIRDPDLIYPGQIFTLPERN